MGKEVLIRKIGQLAFSDRQYGWVMYLFTVSNLLPYFVHYWVVAIPTRNAPPSLKSRIEQNIQYSTLAAIISRHQAAIQSFSDKTF